MLCESSVPIPVAKGKICRQKTKTGTYIQYILERTYDSKKGYGAPKRTLIGRVCADDASRMFPNEAFFKFFPDTAMPELRPVVLRCTTLQVGTHIVINRIVQEYKLLDLLKKHFDRRAGFFLDLVSYLIIEEQNQAQHYPGYAYRHPLFSENMQILSDASVSSFLASIKSEQISGFLNDWNAKRDKRSRIYISYDSTNKNCQAGDVNIVEFGKAKVDMGLPVFNLSVAYDRTNQVPLFYELYPGSINDVSQFKYFVEKALAYNYRRIGFILDRGYFSAENIRLMDENGYHFIMMVKGCKALVSGLVDKLHGNFEHRCDCELEGHYISGTTVRAKLQAGDARERWFHVYFSPDKMASERRALFLKLAEMKKLCQNSINGPMKFAKPYTDYFNFLYDENEILSGFTERTDVIEQERLRCGYFCIITSEQMTALEAYQLYRGRDSSEKLFAADKTFLGCRSMRVHSEESVSAKILIEFVALIVRNRIYNLLKDEMQRLPVKRNYMTVPAAIGELEKIEMSRVNEGRYQLDHAVSRTQEVILNSFGISKSDIKDEAAKLSAALAQSEKMSPTPETATDTEEENAAQ